MEPREFVGGAAGVTSARTSAKSLFTGLVCKPVYGGFMGYMRCLMLAPENRTW